MSHAECAFDARHKSRLRRKTVFDGPRHGHAGSQVNKFPFRRQGHAKRFAPFASPGTKKAMVSDTLVQWVTFVILSCWRR